MVMISADDEQLLGKLVQHYLDNRGLIRRFLSSVDSQITDAIADTEPLSSLVHSVKRRMKDPEHLKDKLVRKL